MRSAREAMPQIGQAAKAHKDKGVVLFGVNLKEDTEKIRNFLEKIQLRLNVATGPRRNLGSLFCARKISSEFLFFGD